MLIEKPKHLSVLIAICLTFAACGEDSSSPATGTTATAHFESTSCDFTLPVGQDPANVECGTLTVPENRSRANGRTITLAVVVEKATGPHPVGDPVVFLSGGPGFAALPGWTAEHAAPLQAKRDLVFFDQRGTGRSAPALQCPEYDARFSANLAQTLTTEEEYASLQSALRACHDRLVQEGVDLTAYTSAATAADLHDLMTALGYTQWNIEGFSYGTRVALTALRDTPQGIRSVVLDSTVPVQKNSADFSADVERSLNTLFAGCARDAACNAKFPDLEQTFFSLVAQLNVSPITVRPKDATTGKPFDIVVSGDRLLFGTAVALSSTTLIGLLPQVITSTAKGNTGLLSLAFGAIAAPSSQAQGMTYSVLCAEEIPFNTPDVVAAAISGVRPEITKVGLLEDTNFDRDVCAFWGAKAPLPVENQPVTSSVPALVLAGEYDPATPPADGLLAAQTLSHSFYFLFPGQGHGQLFNPVAPTCAIDIFAAFLDDPTTRPDGSCVAAMPPPHFLGT